MNTLQEAKIIKTIYIDGAPYDLRASGPLSLVPLEIFNASMSVPARYLALQIYALPKEWKIRISDIARRLGVSRQSASKYLKEILEAKLPFLDARRFEINTFDLEAGIYDISDYEASESGINEYITSHCENMSEENPNEVYTIEVDKRRLLIIALESVEYMAQKRALLDSENRLLCSSTACRAKIKSIVAEQSEKALLERASTVVGVRGDCKGGKGATSEFKPLSPLAKEKNNFLDSELLDKNALDSESNELLDSENLEKTEQKSALENVKNFNTRYKRINSFIKDCNYSSREKNQKPASTLLDSETSQFKSLKEKHLDSEKLENLRDLEQISESKTEQETFSQSSAQEKNSESKKARKSKKERENDLQEQLNEFCAQNNLDSAQKDSIKLWLTYKQELAKKPLLASQISFQLAKIQSFLAKGQDICEVIEKSLNNGWAGLFEVKNKTSENKEFFASLKPSAPKQNAFCHCELLPSKSVAIQKEKQSDLDSEKLKIDCHALPCKARNDRGEFSDSEIASLASLPRNDKPFSNTDLGRFFNQALRAEEKQC